MKRHVLTQLLVLLLVAPSPVALAKNPSEGSSPHRGGVKRDASKRIHVSKEAAGAATPQRSLRSSPPADRSKPGVVSPGPGGSGVHSFAQLHLVTPIDKLPPLASVRLQDRLVGRVHAKRKTIRILITTSPSRAAVRWGGRSLGKTPVTVKAPEGSTPMDIVIRRAGFMTLRTRVQRRISRKYFFKLHPSKFR